MIKCCIFDLDGTLFNTLTTITYYMNTTLRNNGIDEITEEECRIFIGNGARTLVRRALESKNIFDDEIAYKVWFEYNRAYNANTLYLTKVYDGIVELIAALRERGVKLGVLSNKPDDTTGNIVSEFFPKDTFDIVRGGRDSVPLKPAPDGLILLMNDLGVSPDEVMYIGDTGVDIKTGKSAGVNKTVGVLWGFRSREELEREGADIFAATSADILNEVDR